MHSSGTYSNVSGRATRILIAILLTAAAVSALILLSRDDPEIRTQLSVADALAADTAGFLRADRRRAIEFPSDHGPHPGYRTEWWYYTGNVSSQDGRRFGYQLTFFRTELRADTTAAATDSAWNTNQLYMAHFAVTDPTGNRFAASERFSRGAAGLAGAQSMPFRIWLEDWSTSGPTADSVRLRAGGESLSIDLRLMRVKPVVLHGDGGLDVKGPEPGNASYYYSMTRLATNGTIAMDGAAYEVSGWSWMDHEWSTSALGENQVGWDWFSLQLDDGREIMYYQLRLDDGGVSEFSSGSLIDLQGDVTPLAWGDVLLEPSRYWRNPESGYAYPVAWRFQVPDQNVDLRLEALMDDQELAAVVTYWEGAVRIEGTSTGYGYAELTGCGDSEGRLRGR